MKNEKDFSSNFSEVETEIDEIKQEKINNLKDELNETKEKKVRGKAKQIIDEQKKKDEFKKSVSGIGGMFAGMLVKRLPNPLPLDDFEKEQFNLAFDNIAVKYISYIDKYQEETAFAFSLILIILPRLKSEKEKEEKIIV